MIWRNNIQFNIYYFNLLSYKLMEQMMKTPFQHQWGVWFCFVGEAGQSAEQYYKNYLHVYNITTPAELAFLWKEGQLNSLDHFLLQSNSKQLTFQVKDKMRRINSLEYFKAGIEPKWQDPHNQNGGRFIFSVNKTQENKDEIYTNLVFFLLGEEFDHSSHINGFRFISAKSVQTFYRVEIWVDFNDQNVVVLTHYQVLLTHLFKNLNYDSKSVKFLNNKTDQTPKEPTPEVK